MSDAKKPAAAKRKPLTEAEKKKRNDEKIARFDRLAKPRVLRAKKAIELVGNLSGSGYVYTTEQASNIRKILTNSLEATLAKFEKKTKADDEIVI